MALPGTSLSVLQLYYPHVSKLSDFILLTLRDEDKEALANKLVLDSDSANYQNLVNGTLIGCSLSAAAPNRVSLDLLGNDMGSVRRTCRGCDAEVLTPCQGHQNYSEAGSEAHLELGQ